MVHAENNISHGIMHKTLKVLCPTDKWLWKGTSSHNSKRIIMFVYEDFNESTLYKHNKYTYGKYSTEKKNEKCAPVSPFSFFPSSSSSSAPFNVHWSKPTWIMSFESIFLFRTKPLYPNWFFKITKSGHESSFVPFKPNEKINEKGSRFQFSTRKNSFQNTLMPFIHIHIKPLWIIVRMIEG